MGSMTSCISIHAPARGATVSELTALNKNDVFQSTLPRGERPDNRLIPLRLPEISIHAPARGATYDTTVAGFKCVFQSTLPRGERRPSTPSLIIREIFQSTLPRGERPAACISISSAAIFQSTLPRGERPCSGPEYRNSDKISIHAPARGATLPPFPGLYALAGFQSTLPRGERLWTMPLVAVIQ